MTLGAREEIIRGERFAFGRNWSRFLSVLSEARIRDAEASLCAMLEVQDLHGKSFLDVGSGSGLFSLAARRLGAVVSSFDYDSQSVACAWELRRRYFPDDPSWHVEEGSILDVDFVRSKGQFDVVYSWGVLHHTGDMWQALENICLPLTSRGLLFIAIYNDQGPASVRWRQVKRLYCSGPLGRLLVLSVFMPRFALPAFFKDLGRGANPIERYRRPTARGMSTLHDWRDWLGGLPFEVARPEEIFRFFRDRGFALRNLVTAAGGLGNNEYVFVKTRPT